MGDVSYAQCRAAARAVRRAELGREARRVVRPPSVLGVIRDRAPLPIVLYVAARQQRLVWRNGSSFALLERPPALRRARPGPLGVRLLAAVDRRWPLLIFAVPPALLLVAAVVVGLWVDRAIGAWLAVGASAYVVALLLAQVATQVDWLRRVFGPRERRADELAEESLPGWNWTLVLVHHDEPSGDADLLAAAVGRMERLVRADVREAAIELGGEPESVAVREVLVVLTRGITTNTMRRYVAAAMGAPYGRDARVVLRPPSAAVTGVREPVKERGGFFGFYLAGVALVVLITSYVVADWESAHCAGLACVGRPTTFGAALHWLAWRLFLQDPPGLSAGDGPTLAIGWLVSGVGLMTIPVAYVSVRLAIDAQRRAVRMATDYALEATKLSKLLLLTVTSAERDAVLRVVRPVDGSPPAREFTGNRVIYDLGVHGDTRVTMAQCIHQGAAGPGGAITTASEAIRRVRPDFVVMVGICCGLGDDWTPPQRLGDVIVATSVYDLDRRIVFDSAGQVAEERQGERVHAATVLVGRLSASATDWPDAAVHFGLMLSSGALVSSREYRDALRSEHSRAVGYEMEGYGLYSAAAEARVPWAVVKAISDWGYDRDTHYDATLAATNAATFVAHALAIRAFADPARPA